MQSPCREYLKLILLGSVVIAAPAFSAEPENLADGAPLSVEDTKVTETGTWTYQLPFMFERKSNGKDRGQFEPELKVGILKNWHGSISVPILMGSASKAGSGDVRLGLQGKLNDENSWLPSFGVSFGGDLPTGKDSEGVDTRLKLLVTKSIAEKQRVHLNALFENNQDPLPTERGSRRGFVFGYDVQVRSGTLLLADYVYEQALEKGSYDRMLEVGLRHKVKEGVVGLGLGVGLGDSATDWRLGLSWQHNL
jgi:hypothetical protein